MAASIVNEYYGNTPIDLSAMGVQVGDLVVCHVVAIWFGGSAVDPTFPSGWEIIGSADFVYAGSYPGRQTCVYKIITSGDVGPGVTASATYSSPPTFTTYMAARVQGFTGSSITTFTVKNSADASWFNIDHSGETLYFAFSMLTDYSNTGLWSLTVPAGMTSSHSLITSSTNISNSFGIAPGSLIMGSVPRGQDSAAVVPNNFAIALSGESVPITLADLTLASYSLVSGSNTAIQGRSVGSTLSLVNDGNGKFMISNGTLLNVAGDAPAGSYSIVVRETNANATNGPTRDTTLVVTVVESMLRHIASSIANRNTSNDNVVSIPPHLAGDLIYIFQWSEIAGSDDPLQVDGWTPIFSSSGSTQNSGSVYTGGSYKIATVDSPGSSVNIAARNGGAAVYRPGAGWTISYYNQGLAQIQTGFNYASQLTIPSISPAGPVNRFYVGSIAIASGYGFPAPGTLTTNNNYILTAINNYSALFCSTNSFTSVPQSMFPVGSSWTDHVSTVVAFNGTYTAPTVDETAPTITSVPNPSVAAGSALSHALTASETATWTIVGGADQGLFSVTGSTLSMTSQDWSGSNTRQVIIRATDAASNYTEQTITVTILAPSLNALTVSTNSLVVGTPFYTKFATISGLTTGATTEVTVVSGPEEIDLGVEFGATTYVTWYGGSPVPSSLAGQSKTLRITETLYGYSRSTDFTFTVVAVPITFVASATGTTNVVMPTHQAGDLLVLFMFRDGSTTTPALPAGWVNGVNGTGTSVSARLVHKIAGSSSETMGTPTTATSCVVHVYRPGIGFTLSAGAAAIGAGSGTTVTYPALTLQDPSGKSWVANFSGHRSTNTNLQNPPAGSVMRSTVVDATDEAAGHDTNGGVTSWTSKAVSVGGTSSGWEAASIEIKATSVTNSPTGKLFKVSII